MPFTPKKWRNKAQGPPYTYVTADDLNRIEQGVADATGLAEEGGASDSQIAALVTDPESETGASLAGTYAPLGLVPDTIHYVNGVVDYAIAGGIRTDYTWNSDGTCHTETSQGKTKTWTYDSSGNPISSVVV